MMLYLIGALLLIACLPLLHRRTTALPGGPAKRLEAILTMTDEEYAAATRHF